MHMDQSDIKRYPRSAGLIKTVDGYLRGKPKIRDAFLKACTADIQKDAKVAESIALNKALKWAAGPRVDVHEGMVAATEGGKVVVACGYQPPFGTAQTLIITSFFFDAYEFGEDDDRARNADRLIRTVLHEAVHWVRQEAGASDDIDLGYKNFPKEAGHQFEEWAYGSTNICTQDEVFDALLTIGPSGERRMQASRKAP